MCSQQERTCRKVGVSWLSMWYRDAATMAAPPGSTMWDVRVTHVVSRYHNNGHTSWEYHVGCHGYPCGIAIPQQWPHLLGVPCGVSGLPMWYRDTTTMATPPGSTMWGVRVTHVIAMWYRYAATMAAHFWSTSCPNIREINMINDLFSVIIRLHFTIAYNHVTIEKLLI